MFPLPPHLGKSHWTITYTDHNFSRNLRSIWTNIGFLVELVRFFDQPQILWLVMILTQLIGKWVTFLIKWQFSVWNLLCGTDWATDWKKNNNKKTRNIWFTWRYFDWIIWFWGSTAYLKITFNCFPSYLMTMFYMAKIFGNIWKNIFGLWHWFPFEWAILATFIHT